MKREITKHLAAIFEIMGISIYPEGHTRKLVTSIIITLFMVMALCMVLMYMSIHRHAFQDVAIATCCLSSCINSILAYLNLRFKSEAIRQLLTAMDDDIFTYSDELAIVPNYKWTSRDRNMKIVSLTIFIYQHSLMAFLCVTSVIQVLFVDVETAFLYPARAPWNSLLLDWLAQSTSCLAVCISHSLTYIFMLTLSFEFERQSKRLRTTLATAELRARAQSNAYGISRSNSELEVRYIRFLERNFTQCIKHYQNLVRWVVRRLLIFLLFTRRSEWAKLQQFFSSMF